jgi:hypothetical protein
VSVYTAFDPITSEILESPLESRRYQFPNQSYNYFRFAKRHLGFLTLVDVAVRRCMRFSIGLTEDTGIIVGILFVCAVEPEVTLAKALINRTQRFTHKSYTHTCFW